MKNIFLTIFIILVCIISEKSFGQSIVVQCPPCLPISGCNQCWETQQQADACAAGSLRQGSFTNDLDFLSVYPNPNETGQFSIKNQHKLSGEVTIMDNMGNIVQEIHLKGETTYTLDPDHLLNSGIYHLKFVNAKDGQVIVRKLFVNR